VGDGVEAEVAVPAEQGRQLGLVDADDAIDPAGDRRGVAEHPWDDLAEAQGNDRQIVTAQTKRRCAQEDAEDGGDQGRHWKQNPEGYVDVELTRCQDGEGIRANRKEGGVPQVEKARIPDDDVEAQGEQDPDAGNRGHIDLGAVAVDDGEDEQGNHEEEIRNVASPAYGSEAAELEARQTLDARSRA